MDKLVVTVMRISLVDKHVETPKIISHFDKLVVTLIIGHVDKHVESLNIICHCV